MPISNVRLQKKLVYSQCRNNDAGRDGRAGCPAGQEEEEGKDTQYGDITELEMCPAGIQHSQDCLTWYVQQTGHYKNK